MSDFPFRNFNVTYLVQSMAFRNQHSDLLHLKKFEMKVPTSEVLKIAIVGPESTGKSTMSAYLAKHYHTIWVPEFARGYCEKLTAPPTWQDEINMFYGQVALEKELLPQGNKILICDTTFI